MRVKSDAMTKNQSIKKVRSCCYHKAKVLNKEVIVDRVQSNITGILTTFDQTQSTKLLLIEKYFSNY